MKLINFLLLLGIIYCVIEPIVGYIKFIKEEGWKEPKMREFEELLRKK